MFGSAAFAINPADKTQDKPPAPKTTTAKQQPVKPPPRETRMRATGVVKDMTAETLKIERTVTSELMEFSLEKALDKIETGDKVTISYIRKEDKNIATRVSKVVQKKKIASPQIGNAAPPPAPPR